MRSPWSRRRPREKIFSPRSLSSYGSSLIPLTIRVARRCMRSIRAMSCRRKGEDACWPYSRIGMQLPDSDAIRYTDRGPISTWHRRQIVLAPVRIPVVCQSMIGFAFIRWRSGTIGLAYSLRISSAQCQLGRELSSRVKGTTWYLVVVVIYEKNIGTRLFDCGLNTIGNIRLVPLYLAMVRPHLDYAVQPSYPYLQNDLKLIKQMQRLATRCVKSFRRLPCPERLHELKLPWMERHFLRATLITVYELFHRYLNLPAEEFFEPPAAGNLQGHNCKVRQPRFHLARPNAALAVRSAGLWIRLYTLCETFHLVE